MSFTTRSCFSTLFPSKPLVEVSTFNSFNFSPLFTMDRHHAGGLPVSLLWRDSSSVTNWRNVDGRSVLKPVPWWVIQIQWYRYNQNNTMLANVDASELVMMTLLGICHIHVDKEAPLKSYHIMNCININMKYQRRPSNQNQQFLFQTRKNNSTVITRTCQSRCFQRRNRSQASKSSNHWTDWLQRLLLWNASRMAAAHIDAPGPKASIHHRQFGRPRWSHSHGQCSSDQPATNRPKIYHITRLNAYGRWLWLMTMMMNDEQWMIDNDGRWWWWWWSMMNDEWWWSMIW